jgi:hypothetical protein
MLRIMESLLALIILLALAFVANRAYSAPPPGNDTRWQAPQVTDATARPCHRPFWHRHIVPGPQPGTHLQAAPYAYGYFGAHAPTTAAFHTSNRGDWYQWSVSRAD